MSILIAAVVPVALVALVGIILGRAFSLDLQTLTKINIYGMLPALVLSSIGGASVGARQVLGIVAVFVVNTGLLFAIALLLAHLLKFNANDRKSLVATTVLANVGNMGLPFIAFALGQEGLERAVVYLVASSLTIATLFPVVLKGVGLGEGLRFTLRFPVFWAATLGVGLQALGPLDGTGIWGEAITSGVKLLGEGTIPVALVVLGIQLSRVRLDFGKFIWLGAGLRLVVGPAMALGVANVVGLAGIGLQAVVLQSAMPVAVNSLIWVTELGGNSDRVAATIVLSTMLSFGTLPIWLGIVTG